jgi:acetyl-CoA carboxylase biotin carboxyl carrier protein
MDITVIKEIAETMKKNGLSQLELTEGNLSLRMERKETAEAASTPSPRISADTAAASKLEEIPKTAIELDDAAPVKSPMVGLFFAAPSPDSSPYVQVGSRVKKGDTLCIIEAMKLLNEITAERDGEIVEVCAADGQTVEFSQVLFKMR